jgi:hypothetical protein
MSNNFELHPLIAELNNTLLSQNPYNPVIGIFTAIVKVYKGMGNQKIKTHV